MPDLVIPRKGVQRYRPALLCHHPWELFRRTRGSGIRSTICSAERQSTQPIARSRAIDCAHQCMRAAMKLSAGSACSRATGETTVRDFFSAICGEWRERFGACKLVSSALLVGVDWNSFSTIWVESNFQKVFGGENKRRKIAYVLPPANPVRRVRCEVLGRGANKLLGPSLKSNL